MSIPIQTVVRNKITGKIGVVIPDSFNCCTTDETPVVFEGTNYFEGTLTDNLEIIGPENAVADFDKCGGNTEKCCIFLSIVGSSTAHEECQRFSRLRDRILLKKNMRATRHPIELFPKCQLK